ncbi:MAG: hypothetical protein Q4F67_00950 [Propionibacteriaceae bacterium]|nr:hypothetical protein [Propionibacteriaceae bacterium]
MQTQPPGPRQAGGRGIRLGVLTFAVLLVTIVAASFLGYGPFGRDRMTPSEAVGHYLGAVAEADAQAAIGWLAEPPADRTLLTDAVLRESRARAPITAIRMFAVSETQVQASYLIGTQQAMALFDTVRQANGTYRVDRGTTTLELSLPRKLPVRVNGSLISRPALEAFPGSYELTTGLPHVRYAEPEFTVSGPGAEPRLVPTAELSIPGQQAFLRAARAQLDECIEQKSLNPPECPQQVALQDDQRVDSASIEWFPLDDPFVGAQPRLSVTDPALAEQRLEVRMRLSARMTDGGQPGVVNSDLTFATTATGLVTEDPMTVTFVND